MDFEPHGHVSVSQDWANDSKLDAPTIAHAVPRKFERVGQLLGYEQLLKRSEARLHQTEHPHALHA